MATLFFYAALDHEGNLNPDVAKGNRLRKIRGYHPDLGDFSVTFPTPEAGVVKTHFLSTNHVGLVSSLYYVEVML